MPENQHKYVQLKSVGVVLLHIPALAGILCMQIANSILSACSDGQEDQHETEWQPQPPQQQK